MKNKPNIPDPYHFIGEVGEELIVLSRPEIRIAERVDVSNIKCGTNDGDITAEKGNFIIKTQEGEPYPISAAIFWGTYEKLMEVGNKFVGRRLIHERRAWPIISASGAEFNYGPNRGTAFVQKGGWLYQSDDDDFGLINKKVNADTHVVVGTKNEIVGKNWPRRFRFGMLLISVLTPVLALLALLAFAANLSGYSHASIALLILESILLLAGLFLVWWMKKYQWVLKAAILSGRKIATDFQLAVHILGFQNSNQFPDMALWRAAQSEIQHESKLSSDNISKLKELVGKTIESTEVEIKQYERAEHLALMIGWFSALIILVCIGIAAYMHSAIFEAIAIWLPSVVGAVHAYIWRSQVVGKVAADRLLYSQLIFARHFLAEEANLQTLNLIVIIKNLCRVVAVHSQTQIAFALSLSPEPPV